MKRKHETRKYVEWSKPTHTKTNSVLLTLRNLANKSQVEETARSRLKARCLSSVSAYQATARSILETNGPSFSPFLLAKCKRVHARL